MSSIPMVENDSPVDEKVQSSTPVMRAPADGRARGRSVGNLHGSS
ncbi:MAG: hypothetical protein ACKVI4_17810 [Actinomycetales bacterium]